MKRKLVFLKTAAVSLLLFAALALTACDIVDAVNRISFQEGTYTFMPRVRGETAGGSPLDIYVSKVVVKNERMYVHLASTETGPGAYSGYFGGNNWHPTMESYQKNVILYNAWDQTRYVTMTGSDLESNVQVAIFPLINATRLRLENRNISGTLVVGLIDLNRAEWSFER